MKKKFNLEVSSNLDYEGMVVNIVAMSEIVDKERGVYRQKTLAVLNKDKGMENIEIKIYPPIKEQYWEISYDELITVLKKAKELLIEVNKEER